MKPKSHHVPSGVAPLVPTSVTTLMERIEVDATGLLKAVRRLQAPSDERIAAVDRLVADGVLDRLRADVEAASARATPRQIAACLERMFQGNPMIEKGDRVDYVEMIADELMGDPPSLFALAFGTRHFRRAGKFLPFVSEILAAIDEPEQRLRAVREEVEQASGLIARAREELADRAAKLARDRQGVRAALAAGAYVAASWGDDGLDWGAVLEVKADASERVLGECAALDGVVPPSSPRIPPVGVRAITTEQWRAAAVAASIIRPDDREWPRGEWHAIVRRLRAEGRVDWFGGQVWPLA